jgi:hypothetical protein
MSSNSHIIVWKIFVWFVSKLQLLRGIFVICEDVLIPEAVVTVFKLRTQKPFTNRDAMDYRQYHH